MRINPRYLAHMRDLMIHYEMNPESAADIIRTGLIWFLEEKIGNLETKDPSEESLKALGMKFQSQNDRLSQIRKISQSERSSPQSELDSPSEKPETSEAPNVRVTGITERDAQTLQRMKTHLWAGNLQESELLKSQTLRHRALGSAIIEDWKDREIWTPETETSLQSEAIFREIWTRDSEEWIIPQINPNTLANESELRKSFPSFRSCLNGDSEKE